MAKTDKFLDFLDFLAKNGKFCINELSYKLGVSTKTVQRYKKDLENRLGIKFESHQKGCYTIINPQKIKDILFNPDDMYMVQRLVEIVVLLEGKNLEILDLDPDIVKSFKNDIYHLKEYPFEELKNRNLDTIKKAIKDRRYSDIDYESGDFFRFKNVKPLKLVFAEGNWYLAVMTDDEINHGFKFLRLNFIKDFRLNPKTFQKDYNALRFIKEFRTLFTSYMEPDFEVIVEVSSSIARHFKVKKFIKSQQILEEKEDGSLKLRYIINNDLEILMLAKRWLPDMKILEPARIQNELENMCRKFLQEAP